RAGPYAGLLGHKYDPLISECEPFADKGENPSPGKPTVVRGAPTLPNTAFERDLTIDRLNDRRSLLQQIDAKTKQLESDGTINGYDRAQQRAFGLLTASKMKACFDITKEDSRLLDRYGRTLFGQSTLIGRKLIEEGVRFVNVTW